MIFCNSYLEVFNIVFKILNRNKNIIISGGNTIKNILKHINNKKNLNKNKILLSDERLVKKSSKLRNSLFFKKLIKNKFLKKNNFLFYQLEKFNQNYLNKFNNKIKKINFNIAILSLGKPLHVASIFNLKNINKENFFYIHDAPKFPRNRISISLRKILKCKKIILIIDKKKKIKNTNAIFKKKIFALMKKKIEIIKLN